MALFQNYHKKNDMFQVESVWYIAKADALYQNAAELEEGFDAFLPSNGYYTDAREATPEEVAAHLEGIEQARQQELQRAGTFQVGQRIRRIGTTNGRVATVLAVKPGTSIIKYLFDGAKHDAWEVASAFEPISEERNG